MERVAKFLKEAETYYLATVEGDQPRVRPFGTAHIFEGKLYIQTGKVKDVSKQILIHLYRICTQQMMEIPRYSISRMQQSHSHHLPMNRK